jgi:LacI family transcriptional regulator
MFCQSNESYEREVKAVSTLLSSRVDGILVSLCKMTENFDHFRRIVDAGIPVVFFDRICSEIETDRVIVDDEAGAYKATRHLIETGCTNIVHLSGPGNLLIGKNRKNGFIKALTDNSIEIREENIIKCDTASEARAVMPEVLDRTMRPDGIFAVNDLTAAEAMKIVKLKGFLVPDDIAIVGFTSGMISDLTDPSLTSVEQHGYLIGKEAVNLLISRIEKKAGPEFRTRVINTELVVKGSTKRVLKISSPVPDV